MLPALLAWLGRGAVERARGTLWCGGGVPVCAPSCAPPRNLAGVVARVHLLLPAVCGSCSHRLLSWQSLRALDPPAAPRRVAHRPRSPSRLPDPLCSARHRALSGASVRRASGQESALVPSALRATPLTPPAPSPPVLQRALTRARRAAARPSAAQRSWRCPQRRNSLRRRRSERARRAAFLPPPPRRACPALPVRPA